MKGLPARLAMGTNLSPSLPATGRQEASMRHPSGNDIQEEKS